MGHFKEPAVHPEQIHLFPLCLNDFVPKDSDVRFLAEAMDRLDWRGLESSYSDTGRPAYHPRAMAKILVYAYSKGIRSSRKIQELVECDVRYMWLAGGLKPDFHTIARFRKEKWREFSLLFADSVRLCKEAGLVSLDIVAVDGSKIQADASHKTVYDKTRLDRELAEVERILLEAEAADSTDEMNGKELNNKLPNELKDAKNRKEKLDRISKAMAESNSNHISTADPDSRKMKTGDGFKMAYNIQAAVDAKSQIIIGGYVTNKANDVGQIPHIIHEIKANTGLAPCILTADTGYCDAESLMYLDNQDQAALIPIRKQPHESKRNDLFCSRCFLKDEAEDVLICPAGRRLIFKTTTNCGSGIYREYWASGCLDCSFRKDCVTRKGSNINRRVRINITEHLRVQMRLRLQSYAGKTVFGLRKQTVEPVFGQLKQNQLFRRFLLRGFHGTTAETMMIFLSHNLRKYATMALLAASIIMHLIIGRKHGYYLA